MKPQTNTEGSRAMEDRAVTTSDGPRHCHPQPGQRCHIIGAQVHDPSSLVPDLNIKNTCPGACILTWYTKDQETQEAGFLFWLKSVCVWWGGGYFGNMGSIWHREVANRVH